jgi:hypothetical protein
VPGVLGAVPTGVPAKKPRRTAGAKVEEERDLYLHSSPRVAVSVITIAEQVRQALAGRAAGKSVEIWLQDEARGGQQDSLTRIGPSLARVRAR